MSTSVITPADSENVAGTAAYMAPELYDFSSGFESSKKTDVYSFGILLNEVLSECEPYSDCMRKFLGRGPTAPHKYASEGNRPHVNEKIDGAWKQMIGSCWAQEQDMRPTFQELVSTFTETDLLLGNSSTYL